MKAGRRDGGRWRQSYGTEGLNVLFGESFPHTLLGTVMKCYLDSDLRSYHQYVSESGGEHEDG